MANHVGIRIDSDSLQGRARRFDTGGDLVVVIEIARGDVRRRPPEFGETFPSSSFPTITGDEFSMRKAPPDPSAEFWRNRLPSKRAVEPLWM